MERILVSTESGGLGAIQKLLEIVEAWEGRDVKAIYRFRKKGDIWEIAFQGQTKLLNDLKGLHYLSILLGQPGRTYSPEDLVREAGEIPPLPHSVEKDFNREGDDDEPWHRDQDQSQFDREEEGMDWLGDGRGGFGRILTEDAENRLNRRKADLIVEIGSATRAGDQEAAEKLKSEKSSVERSLRSNRGLRGRLRESGSDLKRTFDRVGKAIRKARAVIEQELPVLDRHLEAALDLTHSRWVYQAEQSIPWEL